MKNAVKNVAGAWSGRCAAVLVLLLLAGCTSRGMTVTSNPPGAEVSINRHVVGVTPIRVGFAHYGTYNIELRMRNYETLKKEENIKPGLYGYDPVAFVADNVIPSRLNDEVYLHYVLKPLQQKSDRTALLDRAELARSGVVTDLKTGQQSKIELGREPTPYAAAPAAPAAEAPVAAQEAAPAVDPDKPTGLKLAEEYGITVKPVEKPKPQFVPDTEKKTGPLRIPKDEDLIYDQPAVTDPELKK